MARTNVEIDEELIGRVMSRHGFRTKREAIDNALRNLDVRPARRDEILAMEGMGWEGDSELERREEPVELIWPRRQ